MAVPTDLTQLSVTAASNSPSGSDSIGTSLDDFLRIIQAMLKEAGATLYTAGGTADVITFSTTPTFSAYATGQRFWFLASGANTGAVTLNINGVGAKAVTRDGTTALIANDILSGSVVEVVYDGTRFQAVSINQAGNTVTLTGTQTLTNKTLTAPVINGTVTTTGLTMPALTLGGTVSGGGNQINNVIIGASTPLAGSFTTLSVSGLSALGGATASSWGGSLVGLEIPNGNSFMTNGNNNFITCNAYYNGANWIYKSTNPASLYSQSAGVHNFSAASSGTSGNSITFSTIAAISSTGLAVTGTLSATGALTALSGDFGNTGSSGVGRLTLRGAADATITMITAANSFQMGFTTTGTQRVYVKDGGSVERLAVTGTGVDVTGTLSASSLISTTTKFGVTGSGSVPTAANLEIGTNAAGSRWKINAPTGGEIDLDINGTTVLYAHGTGAGTLGSVTFAVADTTDATSTTAASLKTAGGLGVAKKTYCGDNIVMSSGKGIDFSATSDGSGTTTSEVLSDYEEGTFTPAITFGGAAVGVTYSYQLGRYTKVGRVVHFSIAMALSAKGSSTGAAAITSLPFTSATVTNFASNAPLHSLNMTGLTGVPTGAVGSAVTSIDIVQTTATGISSLTDAAFTATSVLRITGTYEV